MPVQPIFLLSLPRSGSTLVQRVLAAHAGVATSSEPWILLPFLSALHPSMPLAGKWDGTVNRALQDFVQELPSGEEDYLRELRSFALNLYAEAGGNARYFVDKSPPYHLVIEELTRLFPDAKLIFLWRNPLAVVSSMVETISDGRWHVHRFRGDLFHGVANLVAAYRRHQDHAFALRYEDAVTGGHEEWRRLAAYLELEFDPDSLSRFRDVALSGRMGDHSGTRRYSELSGEPLQKWRKTICNPLRRVWCERYLKWIGADRLETMGYSLGALIEELQEAPPGYSRATVDAWDLGESILREVATARVSQNALASSWRLLLGNPTSATGSLPPRNVEAVFTATGSALVHGDQPPSDGCDPLAVPREDAAHNEEAGDVDRRAGG